MSGYVAAPLRQQVAARADYLCEYCLIHESDTFIGCQVEHIISEKHGGGTTADNLAYACAFCNRNKGSDIASLSPRTGGLVRLYNPRTDHWAEHFKLDGALIGAKTDTGEATARLLKMNAADRVTEREALLAAGRYPSWPARSLIEP